MKMRKKKETTTRRKRNGIKKKRLTSRVLCFTMTTKVSRRTIWTRLGTSLRMITRRKCLYDTTHLFLRAPSLSCRARGTCVGSATYSSARVTKLSSIARRMLITSVWSMCWPR
uniref:Uncharacterized protein n=1 Tax=Cacopsylla melanoneura TaxID=428564 RepID=A0A8D8XYS1_9HEMI